MTTAQIISDIQNVKNDFSSGECDYNQAIAALYCLAEFSNTNFSIVYNAFCSSQPEIYFS